MSRFIVLPLSLILTSSFMTGCSQQSTILENPAQSATHPTRPIADAKKAKLASVVDVQGTMIEKCPVSGCWFNLHDETGTIKVDTKAAGFTVVDVPLQTKVTVSGKIVKDGADKKIQASKVSY